MFGVYKSNKVMILNRWNVSLGQKVKVNGMYVDIDPEKCWITVELNKCDHIRVPTETFLKHFERVE